MYSSLITRYRFPSAPVCCVFLREALAVLRVAVPHSSSSWGQTRSHACGCVHWRRGSHADQQAALPGKLCRGQGFQGSGHPPRGGALGEAPWRWAPGGCLGPQSRRMSSFHLILPTRRGSDSEDAETEQPDFCGLDFHSIFQGSAKSRHNPPAGLRLTEGRVEAAP